MAKRNIDNVFEPCDIPAGTHEGCVFCSAQCRLQAVAHLRSVFAVPDAKPVSDAHVLVVPLRHVQDYFDLTARELRDANELLGLLRRRILDTDGSVTGFNVGVNCGVSAGQHVMHVHIHLIPRRGGELYWRQVQDAVAMGAPAIYNAMFDEVDEGTAMYKIAATASDQPTGVQLVSLDADGQNLPIDWYLRLAGAATKMLRGQIPLTPQIPLNPDGSLRSTFATPPPTFRAQITVQTTADWTMVRVSGATLTGWMMSAPPGRRRSPATTTGCLP